MRTLVFALLLSIPLLVDAQAELNESMEPFSFLIGTWGGPAWHTSPAGERQDLYQTERVQPMGGGRVILIEGIGRDGGPDGEVVFNAVGILSYDAEADQYHIDAFNEGRHVRADVALVEGGFDWGFAVGGRQFRYEMRLEDGMWHETGSMIFEGNQTPPFVGLTLSRTSETP